MNKQELLERLASERERLHQKLAAMSEVELTTRPAPGEWSIKDALAHLIWWEQYSMGNIRRALESGVSPQWMDYDQETATNARVFEENRDRSLADVLDELNQSYTQLLALTQELSEADLTDPQRFPWMNGKPLWQYIANEGFDEHYHEHLTQHLSW
jgi:hypothetical protein